MVSVKDGRPQEVNLGFRQAVSSVDNSLRLVLIRSKAYHLVGRLVKMSSAWGDVLPWRLDCEVTNIRLYGCFVKQ